MCRWASAVPLQQYGARQPDLLGIRAARRAMGEPFQSLWMVERQQARHEDAIEPGADCVGPLEGNEAQARRHPPQQRHPVERLRRANAPGGAPTWRRLRQRHPILRDPGGQRP